MYELELHLLKDFKLKTLDDVVECVIEHNMDGKPRDLKELNHLLKMKRKQTRGEFVGTSMDQKTLSVVEPRIEELKRGSGKMFLRVNFEFSRSYPSLYVPVVFKYRVSGVSVAWITVDSMPSCSSSTRFRTRQQWMRTNCQRR